MKKSLLTITQLSVEEIQHILDLSTHLMKTNEPTLLRKNVLFAFEKPSLRTKVGTEVAINHLGGNVIHIEPKHFFEGKKDKSAQYGMTGREALKDTVRNIDQWCDAVFARVFDHQTLLDIDEHSQIPIVNALCNLHHPMQALADLYTVREVFGNEKVAITFVGDANNVAFSLFEIMLKFGHSCRFASPETYSFSDERKTHLQNLAKQYGGEMLFTHNPVEAVKNTNVIYADVFVSMGEESVFEQKIRAFSDFQVNKKLFSHAAKNAIFMHCLPAHRGVEVTDEVMDSKQSVIYQQAKNRMVVSKGVFTTVIHEKDK